MWQGGRYGSLEPTSGKSYTHLEYEYAASQNKPLFACVVQEEALERRVKADGTAVIEISNASKLGNFREQVLCKLCKFWEDAKDIKIAVTETLAHIARREELVGWVRPTGQTDLAALLNEMTRLSNENAKLRAEVRSPLETPQFSGLNFVELKSLLDHSGATSDLINNRTVLSRGGTSLNGSNHINELVLRGLIVRNLQISGQPKYVLTDQGRSFLNKYDFELLTARPS